MLLIRLLRELEMYNSEHSLQWSEPEGMPGEALSKLPSFHSCHPYLARSISNLSSQDAYCLFHIETEICQAAVDFDTQKWLFLQESDFGGAWCWSAARRHCQ